MPRSRPWRLPVRSLVFYLAVLASVLAVGLVLVEQGIRRQVAAQLDSDLSAGQRAAVLLWSRAVAPGLPAQTRLRELQALAATQAVLLQAPPATLPDGAQPVQVGRPGETGWQVAAATVPAALAQEVARWRAHPATSPDANGLVRLGGERFAARIVPLPASAGARSAPGGGPSLVLLRSVREVSASHDVLRWTLFGLLFLALAVLAGGAAWLTRRVVRPLRALAQSVHRLGGGDYSTPVPLGDAHALGALAQAIEAMRLGVMHRESEIRRLAFRDALTGLPNREQFRADLRHAIEQAAATGKPCTVLMLDLDRFKHVNDVLGPRLGDRLLQLVAQRLRDAVLSPDHRLARLGGDEFAVLLPATDAAGGLVVAQRILKSCERPIVLYDHTVDLGAGIGIASAPAHGRDADELLSHAEVAMYAAKHQQAGTVTYHPGLDSSSQESLTLQGELRQAVDQGQLQIWLQPKVSLISGQVIGAEALLRWQHPERGLVPPMRFIYFAEQTGFVRVLTSWMIERTALTWRALRAQGFSLKLSVNLSTRDLMDQDLPDKVARLLAAHAVEPGALCLEITESAIMDDPQRALATLERLHTMGLRLSIDDFGTGYSSLAYLKRLPVDELKIDKSFVMNMESDLSDAKIVRSTVDLAHNLGLAVVAEGVENAKAWKLLSGLRCDEAQGHFIARAMPVDTFVQWARLWSPPHTADERLGTEFAAML
ncbi:MAG: putative bifunctional diguanylate cyclase/phosphodiesterase [Pseudomonadota bacterium]